MVPDDLRDFFVASAGVAGALVGLLFVVLSVTGERLTNDENAPIHRIRAAAALSAFTNALTVSLFALTPGKELAIAAIACGFAGLAFTLASTVSLVRLRILWTKRVRDALFLIGLMVVYTWEAVHGIQLDGHPDRTGQVESLAGLVVACFLIGIYRAWDLIGGPSFGLRQELVKMITHQDQAAAHNQTSQQEQA